MLQEVIGNNFDVLLISETKLDASFPSIQFILDGFTPPYRLDRTQHGGGIMLFIREGIPSKLIDYFRVGIRSTCSRGPGFATRIIFITHFF